MSDRWSARWWPASTATTDALVAQLGPGSRAGHLCPRCGGDDHGRPWARVGREPVAASASRAGEWLVTVVRAGPGRIGVDIELDAVAALDPGLVLHDDDPHDVPLLEAWVRKEAIVKAIGAGLAIAPASVRLADHELVAIDAPPGLTAVVCLGPSNDHGLRG